MKKLPEKIYLFKYRYGDDPQWELSTRNRCDNVHKNWRDVTYIEIDTKEINKPISFRY